MMISSSFVWLNVFALFSKVVQGQWSNEVYLSHDPKVHLSWEIRGEIVTFEVTAEALGYVAVGFSPHWKNLNGMDSALGWVTDDGDTMFYDMYMDSEIPVVDDSQDYMLIDAKQNSSHTTMKFKRRLITCDTQDFDLSDDTLTVIWACNDEDPKSVDNIWGMEAKMGVKIVYLMSNYGNMPTKKDMEEYEYWDIMSPQIRLSRDVDTVLWCSIVKAPTSIFNVKHHIVGSYPIVEKDTEYYVSYIGLNACNDAVDGALEKYVDHEGAVCYSEDMPREWLMCLQYVTAAGFGTEGEMLSRAAGVPVHSTEDNPAYYLLQVHYDNPKRYGGMAESGLRLFYTDDLRPNDASVFLTGAFTTPLMIIPPGQETFPLVGFCASENTQAGIPPEGITVTQVTLVTHRAGVAVRFRHFRGGREMTPIVEDNNYNPFYLQPRVLSKPRKVLPGDDLVLECEYNTMDRDNVTYNGIGRDDEMCLAYVVYYPAMDFMLCLSQPSQEAIASVVKQQRVNPEATKWQAIGYSPTKPGDTSLLKKIVYKSPDIGYFTLQDAINYMTWTNEDVNMIRDLMTIKDFYVSPVTSNYEVVGKVGDRIKNPTMVYGARRKQKPRCEKVFLDDDSKVHLSWVIRNEYITFDLSVNALGYVGMGFAPKKEEMKGSDIALGWVTDDGDTMFYDMYAEDNVSHTIDDSQDYELMYAKENATHTMLCFRRKLVTCDNEQDYTLGDDTVSIGWSYSSTDPETVDDIMDQEDMKGGIKSVYLMPNNENIPTEKEMKEYDYWDVMSPEIELKGDSETVFWCSIVKAPSRKFNPKKHIVGAAPIFQEGSKKYVYDMALTACHGAVGESLAKYIGHKGMNCHSDDKPKEWDQCAHYMVAWGVGSDGEMFTKEAGVPLHSTDDDPTYFLLQVHYDNPMLDKGVVDSSGLRLFYTDDLRLNDLSLLLTGAYVTPLMMIPPRQEKFPVVGFCSSEYTEAALPPGGITVTQVSPVTHRAGVAVRFRHFRGGRELTPLVEDNNYDPYFLQSRTLSEPVKILPGDDLVLECEYDTRDRNNVTFGGLGTYNELCIAYLSYYPPLDLMFCVSQPSQEAAASIIEGKRLDPEETKWKAIGHFSSKPGDISLLEKIKYESPKKGEVSLLDEVNSVKWTREQVDALKYVMTRSTFYVVCGGFTYNVYGRIGEQVGNPATLYGERKKENHMKKCDKDMFEKIKRKLNKKLKRIFDN